MRRVITICKGILQVDKELPDEYFFDGLGQALWSIISNDRFWVSSGEEIVTASWVLNRKDWYFKTLSGVSHNCFLCRIFVMIDVICLN